MDKNEVIVKLRELLTVCGTQARLAKHLGISVSYLGELLRGTRNPGPRILRALNLKKEVQYNEGGTQSTNSTRTQ